MEKLKIILIDDEVLIRKLIRMKIDWDALNMDVIAEFSSSQKALENLEGLQPDIIITDICMPGMDGIEFSEECIGLRPHVKIIILTGHDEFNYAMRSIKIGVSDYILKPINGENITQALIRAREKINKEKELRKEYEKLASRIEENLPAFRENYLNQALLEAGNAEVFCKQMKYYGAELNPESTQIQVAVIGIEMPVREVSVYKLDNNEMIFYLKARELTEEFFTGDSYFLFCRDGMGRIVVLSNNPAVPLIECMELLKKMLITRLKCHVNIGISSVKSDYGQMTTAYGEAVEAFLHKIVEGNNSVICYDYLDAGGKEISSEEESIWKEAKIYIRAGMREKAEECIRSLWKLYRSGISVKDSQVRNMYMEICSWCLSEAIRNDICGKESYQYSMEELYVQNAGIIEYERKALECAGNLSMDMAIRDEKRSGSMIHDILEYMSQNLDDPNLSMNKVAEHAFISTGYLGRIMKKHMGKTYGEYISELRFCKAKELLKNTDLKGYEIGNRIGIPDAHYLSIWFKKMSGYSLSEYRRMEQGTNNETNIE